MNGKLMRNPIAKCAWLLGSLSLGVTVLVAQSQPPSQSPPQPQAPAQAPAQPPSAQQQEIDALADKLIAAPSEEARNALLSTNSGLVTVELVRAINRRGRDLLLAGKDVPKQRAVYEIALTIAQRLNDKEQISNCLDNIGLVLETQGDYEASMDYQRRALALAEETKNPNLADFYNNIGITLRKQGNFREAADYLTRSLKLREAQGNKRGMAQAAFNLGNVYYELGNLRLALQQYQKSLEISKELGIQIGVAYNTDAFGHVYETQGDYDLALSYLQQSLQIKEKVGNPREIANTIMNIGSVNQKMGNAALARESFEKALKLKEAANDKEGVALILKAEGQLLREQGNYVEALERDQASLKISEAIGHKSVLSQTLIEMARVYSAGKDYTRALELGQRASQVAREIGATATLSQALDVSGLALAGLGRAEEARSTMTAAIGAVEELRGEVTGSEEQQVSFLAKEIDPYRHLVQLLVSENNAAEAFEMAERAKARVLLDVMRSGRVRIDKAMTAQESDQERKLVSRQALLNVQLSGEKAKPAPNGARIAQLNADLDQARLDYRGFQTTLYVAHPELQVERGDAKPASPVQGTSLLLDAKTALLEFQVTEDKTYLFALVKGADPTTPQLTAYTLPIGQKDLATGVDRFREQLASRSPDYSEPARALYRLLLRPARAALAGKTTIIIVPDGPLWELPFQATQSSAGHHLLEDAAISYAPSLTVLLEMVRRHGARSEAQRLLALGNPAFSKQDADRLLAQASLAPSDHALRDLPVDLPNARREVTALSRLYGSQSSAIYTGAAATEQTFKADAGKYDVLHLATHGVFDNRNPMYSHLLLAGPGTSGDDDGLLEAWEVVNLNLKADLVVLSACETARGKASGGEGLIGMSWAFFVAGSPSLVASQWKVDSASTTELMVNFHRGLRFPTVRPGYSAAKSKALQQAALRVMKSPQYRHPFYWAGFVLVGDGS